MKISRIRKSPLRAHFLLKAGPHQLKLGQKTLMMGIINLTPDSFSRDGCFSALPTGHHLSKTNFCLGTQKALLTARRLIKDGADILDIGGESTRPGSQRISAQEEIKRIIPTVRHLARKVNVPISVDTYKPEVAQHALDAGAVIINNIMGTKPHKGLLRMVKNYHAAIVLMHIQGTPRTMQKNFHYKNLICEIIDSLRKSIENCLEIGIKSDKIIIDPGIGFGKAVEHNLRIINHLDCFKVLKKPILIGTSRKSFIGKILNKEVQDRLIGTVATVCASILNGAHIVRVHDVKAVKEAVLMTDAILKET